MWQDVELVYLAYAMGRSSALGIDAFREWSNATLGVNFIEAHNLHVQYPGLPNAYEARPLIAAAYYFQTGNRIGPPAFNNNDAHNFLVQAFHFQIIQIGQ